MNFKRNIDRNQKLILYIIAIIIFILFIIHALNNFYEEKEKEKIENISKNNTNQTNTTSQKIITKEEANEIKNDSVDDTMKLLYIIVIMVKFLKRIVCLQMIVKMQCLKQKNNLKIYM